MLRPILFLVSALVILTLSESVTFFQSLQLREPQIFKGIIGNPLLWGYCESIEKWFVLILLIGGAVVASIGTILQQRSPRWSGFILVVVACLFIRLNRRNDFWESKLILLVLLALSPWHSWIPSKIRLKLQLPRMFVVIASIIFLYVIFYRSPEIGFTDTHESEIYWAATNLLHGKIPYRDLFIPHGIGIAWLGVLGMKCFGETLQGFRMGYLFLAPVVWILLYLLFLRLNPSRPILCLTASLLSGCLSALHQHYPVANICWFSGIRLIFPIFFLILAINWNGERRKTLCLGLLAGAAYWFSIVSGVACILAGIALTSTREGHLVDRSKRFLLFSVGCAFLPFLYLAPHFSFFEILRLYQFHTFEFPKEHSLFWGRPLFERLWPVHSLVKLPNNLTEHIWWVYFPILTMIGGATYLLQYWKRLRTSEKNLFVSLIAISFCLYQLAIGRSDSWHLREGLGLSGVIIVLLLFRIQGKRTSTILSGFIVVVILIPKLLTPRHSTATVFDPRTSQLLEATKDFLIKNPKLERRAFFFTELGPLLKTELRFSEPSKLPLFHYLITEKEQKTLLTEMVRTNTDLVFYRWDKARFDGDPRFLRWAYLSQSIFSEFRLCQRLGMDMWVMIRKERVARCDFRPEVQVGDGALFPTVTDFGELPSRLTTSTFDAEIGLEITPRSVERTLQLVMPCKNLPYELKATLKLPGNQTSFRVPVSVHPLWHLCDRKFGKLKLADVITGERIGYRPIREPSYLAGVLRTG